MEVQERARISTFRRYLWHFNRTPGAHLIKALARTVHYPEVAARKRLARGMPENEQFGALAAALNENGYVSLDRVIDRTLLATVGETAEDKLKRADEVEINQRETHKTFWVRLLDEDMVEGQLPTDNPFVQFAIQPAVIGVLARALGEIPKLDYVLLTLSRPSNKPLSYSQLWHRDHDDPRTIKLFIYLTDVSGGEDGPFTFVPRAPSMRSGFSLRSHRPDAAVFKRVKPEEVHVMLAPRLSVFLVETSRCLHMGSRVAPGHRRLLYTATYFRAPRIFPEPPSPFQIVGHVDPVTRMVLGHLDV